MGMRTRDGSTPIFKLLTLGVIFLRFLPLPLFRRFVQLNFEMSTRTGHFHSARIKSSSREMKFPPSFFRRQTWKYSSTFLHRWVWEDKEPVNCRPSTAQLAAVSLWLYMKALRMKKHVLLSSPIFIGCSAKLRSLNAPLGLLVLRLRTHFLARGVEYCW